MQPLALPRVEPDAHTPSASATPSGPVHVKTGPREVHKFVAKISLSSHPSDLELSTVHALPELLVPMKGDALHAENADLAAAIMNFKNKNSDEDLSDLEQFVSEHPNSRWCASLDLNLALLRYRTGHLSKALPTFASVWKLSKNDSATRSVANRAVAMLSIINARLGRQAELSSLLAEIESAHCLAQTNKWLEMPLPRSL